MVPEWLQVQALCTVGDDNETGASTGGRAWMGGIDRLPSGGCGHSQHSAPISDASARTSVASAWAWSLRRAWSRSAA